VTYSAIAEQPKHRRIYEDLRRRVIARDPGSRLDSIRTLMRSFAVSQVTITKALEALRNDGLLDNRPGAPITVTAEVLKYRADAKPVFAMVTPNWASASFSRVESEFLQRQEADGFIGEVIRFPWQDDVIRKLPPQKFDGLIIMPSANLLTVEQIRILNSFALPYVIFGQQLRNLDVSAVYSNNEFSAAQVADHFIKLGHRKVALMVTEPRIENIEDRISGFCNYCKLNACQVETIDCQVANGEDAVSKTYHVMQELLQRGRLPFTALMTISEAPCLAVLRACHEHGIRIPEELSVASIGNSENSEFYYPSLTTVASDHGAEIARALQALHQLRGYPAGKRPIIKACIETRLLVRRSSGVCCE